ncbi:MAG: AsmA-like C-terminal region-containing protein, partial [Vicinamibacterales bacterium]
TAELSRRIGQPVRAARLSVGVFPRLRLTLHDVSVGTGPLVHVDRVALLAGLPALITRRLDDATLVLSGLESPLPLPLLAFGTAASRATSSTAAGVPGPHAAVDLQSIGTIRLEEGSFTTRGRTIQVDGELLPHDDGSLTVRDAAIRADEMNLRVDGNVLTRPELAGTLTVRANTIDADLLLAAAAALAGRDRPHDAGEAGAQMNDRRDDHADARSAETGSPAGGVKLDIEAGRVSLGPLSLANLDTDATLRRDGVVLEPLAIDLYGGKFTGQIAVRLEDSEPSVRWYGDIANLEVNKVLAAVGAPEAIDGVLNGDVDLTGIGTDFLQALKSVRGSARLQIAKGIIRDLGLARSVLTASSPRPHELVQDPPGPPDTAFDTLSATLTVSGGSASLVEVHASSPELSVEGGGGFKLDGSIVTVFTALRLSPDLSQQVATLRGRTLTPDTRLEVPATIRGSTSHYSVEVDVAEMTAVQ